MKKSTFSTLLIALTFLVSCNKNEVYKSFEDIPLLTWKRANVIGFETTIEDISIPYNVNIEIRHSAGIQYGDLALLLKQINPSGEDKTEVHYFKIRDEDGSLRGSAMGDLVDTRNVVIENHLFPEAGKYVFGIAHDMKEDDLTGILEVGLILEKVPSE